MNRAERRRQAKEMSKSKMPLPLNVALPVERDADITGQEAITLKTYLELKEKEIRENVTAALMKEAQEKLAKAEDYIAIINILIVLYASKMAWGYTEENKKLMDNYKAARVYVDRKGAAAARTYASRPRRGGQRAAARKRHGGDRLRRVACRSSAPPADRIRRSSPV